MANWRERRKLKVSKPLRPGTLAVPVDPEGPLEPGGYLLLPEAARRILVRAARRARGGMRVGLEGRRLGPALFLWGPALGKAQGPLAPLRPGPHEPVLLASPLEALLEAAQALGEEAWAGVDLEVALVGRRWAVLGGFLYGEGQAFLAFLDPKEAE